MKKSEFSISNEEKVKKIRSLKSIEILFLFFFAVFKLCEMHSWQLSS